ncbi:Bug family tripartite tricarboxylate transporter substrate binding protein [Variovorax sp. PBL-E5]|uniref:Bug family tripartite tricarboxylate transporter substrate binding protein n=1 Tax=Variovorax sp. PBL-E5 TaxID=434014 RepID=UPI001318E982|nr:tripartite tricarboxylate transporter substrate binding protein [Variovorax sp. PBL-E5]VTU45574.1 Argininosuccinate lyase [Variovorax sp. PBL-E5]
MSLISKVRRSLLPALALVLPLAALAQGVNYPSAPVRVIVPYPPGGSLDAVIRPFAEKFQQATGQTLIVENLGGAGGLIAGAKVAQSKPDGYTLFLASNGQVSLAPLLYTSMSYDPERDLVPIIHLTDQVAVLYANAQTPYKTVADVIAAAKAAPGTVAFASTGAGGISHLAIELLGQATGAKFNHVPYKGAAPALQDLAGGQVPLLFTFVGSAKGLTASGHVRPIAVAADKRLPSLPDVPTFAEAGVPGIQVSSWMGLMGPRDMPASAVRRMAEVADDILKQPDFQKQMADISMEIRGGSPASFRAAIQADTVKWSKLAKTVNLKQQQ